MKTYLYRNTVVLGVLFFNSVADIIYSLVNINFVNKVYMCKIGSHSWIIEWMRFVCSGRTEKQMAAEAMNRPAPQVVRTPSKRHQRRNSTGTEPGESLMPHQAKQLVQRRLITNNLQYFLVSVFFFNPVTFFLIVSIYFTFFNSKIF